MEPLEESETGRGTVKVPGTSHSRPSHDDERLLRLFKLDVGLCLRSRCYPLLRATGSEIHLLFIMLSLLPLEMRW